MEKKCPSFMQVQSINQKSCLTKLCEYVFVIPGNNANMKRMFSLMSSQWLNERNWLSEETTETILVCHYNFKMTLAEFYNYVG